MSTERHTPHSLPEALDALERDRALTQAVGQELVDNLVAIKRAEIAELADKDEQAIFDYYAHYI